MAKTKKASVKKRPANGNANGWMTCHLRVLRGRKQPHGPDGSRLQIEVALDDPTTTRVAANMLRRSVRT